MTLFARVVFPLPLEQSFLYAVPEACRAAARPGARVVAPLGARRQNGFIVEITAEPPAAKVKVKELVQVLDDRPFRDERFLAFTGRLSREHRSSWGEILQTALPPSLAGKTKVIVRLAPAGEEALNGGGLGPKARLLAAALAVAPKGRSPLFLRRKIGGADVSGLVTRMEKAGFVTVERTFAAPPGPPRRPPVEAPSSWGCPSPDRPAKPAAWPRSKRPSPTEVPGPGIFSAPRFVGRRPSKPWSAGPSARAAASFTSIPK